MGASYFDLQTINVPCPECSEYRKETVAWFKSKLADGFPIPCRNGHNIRNEATKLLRAIEAKEHEVTEFFAGLNRVK